MKKSVIILLSLVFGVFLLQFISAETTFFEGDLGYGDDFIMSSLPEDVADVIANEEIEILQVGGGGYFLEQQYNTTLVCEACANSLRDHIREHQDIDYNEEEVIILTEHINQEFQTDLSNNQVRYIIENFEEECDSHYPLLGGFAGGRLRNLTDPLVLGITIILLISIILLGYFIIRALKKRGYGRQLKVKKIKHKFK